MLRASRRYLSTCFGTSRRGTSTQGRLWRAVGPGLALVLVFATCTPRQEQDELLNLPLPSESCGGGYGDPVQVCVVHTEKGAHKRIRASGLLPRSELRVALASKALGDPGQHVHTVSSDEHGQIAPIKKTEFTIPGTTFVLLTGTSATNEPVVGSLVVTTAVPVKGEGPPPTRSAPR